MNSSASDGPLGLSVEAADAELARVQVELAERAAGATPLSGLALTVRDLSPVQPMLDRLLQAAADATSCGLAVLWVYDPSAQQLHWQSWTGRPDAHLDTDSVVNGERATGAAVAQLRSIAVTDIRTSPLFEGHADAMLEAGWAAAYVAPMVTLAREPMGALSLYFAEPHTPTAREQRLVDGYARQAAAIVERARLHAEARTLSARERVRATQLRLLADTALRMGSADDLDTLLTTVTRAARQVIGAHQAVTSRLRRGWTDAQTHVELSEKYAEWRDYDVVPKGLGVLNAVTRDNRPLRLTGEELVCHPDWRGLADSPGHPPLPDYLAAPLVGRDGSNLGLIQLSDKEDGTAFSAEDEAMLVQLAQMASSTVERLEALEGERAARREAEEAARLRGLLSDASAVFSASLDPDEVVQSLCDLVVPRLADWMALHLRDEDSEHIELAAAVHHDDEAEGPLCRFLERFPISLDMPYGAGAALRTGTFQLFPELPDEVLQALARSPEDLEEMREIVLRSGLVLPLTARGRTIGALSMCRDAPYAQRDVDHGLDLAARAALALDNARRYTFERGLAATLQRSLLPQDLPSSDLLSSASRYLPGARGTQIGGDWYDLIDTGDGSFVLVVGDVMGRGVQAATIMGQLRATVRAYALEGHGPCELLTRLDRVVQSIGDVNFTTCIVGRLDARDGRLCIAGAGHLPPLLLGPDGGARYVELDPGLPLGVGDAQFVEQQVVLEPGSTVLLYTDGLIEGPDSSLDEGMQLLLDGLRGGAASAEEVCDRALRVMGRDDDHDDDTALLALRMTSRTGEPPVRLALPAVPESASTARAAVLELLEGRGHGSTAETAALLVTELVANAARHAGGDVLVLAELAGGQLRVEVQDTSDQLPLRRTSVEWEREGGRGVMLVEELADGWGADLQPEGKRVWFSLAVDGE